MSTLPATNSNADDDFSFPEGGNFARPKAKPAAKASVQAPTKDEAKTGKEEDTSEEKSTPKYSQIELMKVFDTLIFESEYSEEITIRDKLKVVLRTRSQKEIAEITTAIDATQAVLLTTMEQNRAILNLQYALLQYGPRNLRNMKLEEKAAFVEKLPGPIIGALLMALGNFDSKVYQACQEGESNF